MSQSLYADSGTPKLGYWLVLSQITDPLRFKPYQEAAMPIIASFGGRAIARGDLNEVVEGAVAGRPYFIEFPSFSAAKDCYYSDKYQAAITLRNGVAQFNIVIVEGVKPE